MKDCRVCDSDIDRNVQKQKVETIWTVFGMVRVILYKVISTLRSSIVIFIVDNVKGKRNKKNRNVGTELVLLC